MHPFWNTRLGKLFIGGCGTQVGLVFSCGTLAGLTLLCAVCAFFNVVSLGIMQEVSIVPANVPAEVAASAAEGELLDEITVLRREVEFLRASGPAVPQPPAPPPKPMAIAIENTVNLRSGPDVDYKKVGSLSRGSSLEIVGRNANSTWWLVSTPGGLAWVSDMVVTTTYVDDRIPVVTIPALLVQPAASSNAAMPPSIPAPPTAAASPTPPPPPAGTPIPGAEASRQFVEDMSAYKRLRAHLLIPPVSASLSPDGSQIAITERIKLYTVTTEGALTTVWLEEDDTMGPLGNLAWSPDGEYLAFVIGYKQKYCQPCRGVGLVHLADETITYLEPPGDLELDAPRWTEDGRLLVSAHRGEPADSVAYIYETWGQGQLATGSYTLSSSHYGQRWYPWLPGKTWQVGSTVRADSYNSE